MPPPPAPPHPAAVFQELPAATAAPDPALTSERDDAGDGDGDGPTLSLRASLAIPDMGALGSVTYLDFVYLPWNHR
jgi:hypothetical protein